MKVFFVSFEATGIYKTGGLGDVAASLPVALKKKGINISLVMPGYNQIKKPKHLHGSTIPVFYIKNPDYFDLTKKYGHAQNFERFFYFCQKVVELINKEKPDIVHLNDWHTGMIAYLIKCKNFKISKGCHPELVSGSKGMPKPVRHDRKIPKVILTIHNAGFQGDFSLDHVDDFKNKKTKEEFLKLGFKGRINFLKTAIDYADFVNTVSPNYAYEMLHKNLGYGLEKNLRKKSLNFTGILNGIDYSVWNPEKDQWIEANYELRTEDLGLSSKKWEVRSGKLDREVGSGKIFDWRSGKKLNKVALQRKLKLPIGPYIPVVAFIARLSWQKGIEKIIEGITELSKMDLQLIILGTGDKFYEEKLTKLKKRYEDRFLAIRIKFDEQLAHQIYAGSDLFLIPSRYEPCGLTQIIAMRYGTIPVARKTGGLVDTIKDGETGFLFGDDTSKPMLRAIKKAVGVYYNWVDWLTITKDQGFRTKDEKNEKFIQWPKIVERVMKEDFSWEKSAEKYLSIYKKLLNKLKVKS